MSDKEETTVTAGIGVGIAHGVALACFAGAWLDDHGYNVGYFFGAFVLLFLWGGAVGALGGSWVVLRNRKSATKEEGN